MKDVTCTIVRSEFVRIYNIRSHLQLNYDDIYFSYQDKSLATSVQSVKET